MSIDSRPPIRVEPRPRDARPVALSPVAHLGLFAVGSLVALLVLAAAAERIVERGRVLPGVAVGGVAIGGQTEREADARLDIVARRVEATPVPVRAGRHELTLDPASIGLRVDTAASVREARRDGRGHNPVDQAGGFVLRRVRRDQLPLVVRFDRARLDNIIDGWVRDTAAGLQNGGLRFDGTRVVEIAPRRGIGVDGDVTRRRIVDALRYGSSAPVVLPYGPTDPPIDRNEVDRVARRARRVLSAPVGVSVDGTTLTLTPGLVATTLRAVARGHDLVLHVDQTALHAALGPGLAALETPVLDAAWSVDGTHATVVPSRPGRVLDLRGLGNAMLHLRRIVTGELHEVRAVHDTAWAKRLDITELVSTFTTHHACCQTRVTNIHRAADAINGTIVEPGQTFSLNGALGPRTTEKGYVAAPAIGPDLALVDEVGGGVSQLSTTLFNATFFGGYEDITHTVHAFYISRYPMGREATLNYPSIDNVFRNDSHAGVLIKTSYTATSVTVSFYGSRGGRTVRAEGPNILETLPPDVKYVDDPTLPPGATKVLNAGQPGYAVENFRIISRPGQPDVRQRFVAHYSSEPTQIARNPLPAPPPATPAGPPGPPTTTGPAPPPSPPSG